MGQSKTNTVAHKRATIIQDYKRVFGSVSGKRVLKDLMQIHNFYSSSFSQDSDTLTAFNEGKRDVILRILHHIKVDVDDLMKMIEEMEDDDRT